ncbi:hypothetical protein HDU79_004867 [Rhizoclosmatium sp. JEL0117]|nr:hypothetical protein HDU79_004867 [Rhizoclosmatium sp. JEL0117]
MKLPHGETSVTSYIATLCRLIRQYDFLYLHHAVDFYIEDYWNSAFPTEWTSLEQTATTDDLIMLASKGIVKPEWPESLKAFIRLAQELSLCRIPDDKAKNLPIKPLPAVLKNGMSPKKQHEVAYLSSLINSVTESEQIDHVLDIGAGQGYLDISLAYQYDKIVVGVDDDEIQTCGAKRRIELANKQLYKNTSPQGEIYHINRRVQANEKFSSLVEEVVGAVGQEPQTHKPSILSDSRFLLCGLHACGDLTPAIMKHFLESDAGALVCVGCCYNRISESRPEIGLYHETEGFPLSNYMRSQSPRFQLGFSARNLACQAVCRWDNEEGRNTFLDNGIRLHYRALLQLVLHDHGLMEKARRNSKSSTDHDIIIGRLKEDSFRQGFATYAKLACSRLYLDLENEGVSEVELREYETRFKITSQRIAIVWTLRSMMGDVFESLLLADRFQFLHERRERYNLQKLELFPLFDPVVSPRNMVLVATKKGN